MKPPIVLLLIVSFTATVAVGQKYKRPVVQTPTALDRTNPVVPSSAQTLADIRWSEVFQDEKLQGLVTEALTYNYDVRDAVARVNAARANLGLTKSEQYPQIAAGAGLVTEHRSRDGSIELPAPLKQNRTFGNVLLNLL